MLNYRKIINIWSWALANSSSWYPVTFLTKVWLSSTWSKTLNLSFWEVSHGGIMAREGSECKWSLLKLFKCRPDNGVVVTQDSRIQRTNLKPSNWLPSFAPTLISHFHLGIRHSQPSIAPQPHTHTDIMILYTL